MVLAPGVEPGFPREADFKSVADGTNPLALRREARAALTVAQLATRFRLRHFPHLSARSREEYGEMLDRKILPGLGKVKARDLDRPAVAKWHGSLVDSEGRGARQANYALAVLSKMMALAEIWGEREEGSNPWRGVARFPEGRRQRYLTPEELGLVARALDDSPAGDAIRMLLLTGMRLGEVLALRRSWVQDGQVTIPADKHKAGRKMGAKTLPLSVGAQALLEGIPKMLGADQVFAVTENQLERHWRAVRAVAGCPDVKLHDLRHSFASYGAAKGLSLPVIGALLGHLHQATTQRYAHLAQSPLRAAVEEIGAALDAAMKKKAPEGA